MSAPASHHLRNSAATTATMNGTSRSPANWNTHIGPSNQSGRSLTAWKIDCSHPGTSPPAAIMPHDDRQHRQPTTNTMTNGRPLRAPSVG